MKNARGFSLVEIMVVTALSTVVIAGVVTMVTNVSAQTDLVLQKQDMDQIVQEVTAALLNRDICTSNLRGLNLSNGSTPDTINSIRYLQPDGTPGATIANIGLSRKGLRIDAITIVPVATNDGATIAELSISPSYQMGMNRVQGSPRKINRSVLLQNGRVFACATLNSDQNSTGESMCSVIGKVFDSATGKCVDQIRQDDIKWCAGTTYEATCRNCDGPGEWVPNPFSGWPCGCWEPRGYQDSKYLERDFDNGGRYGAAPSPYRQEWRANEGQCRCSYASDINVNEGNGWRTAIECKKKGPND